MRKMLAFLKRDIQEMLSYKLAFAGELLGVLFPLLTFYFVSRLLDEATIHSLAPYGGEYFPFVLIGVAFSSYLMLSMHSFTAIIRSAQVTGTLEALLSTKTDLPAILVSSSVFPFIRGAVNVLLYLAAGAIFFNVSFTGANVPGAFIISVLTVLSFAGIGIISAGFVMIFKKGDPVTWLLGSASALLGGVMYPVAILPGWLRKAAQAVPLTHSLEGIRKALLAGAPTNQLYSEIQFLTVLSAILLPAGIIFFYFAVKKAKRDGTLTQY